MKKLQKSWPIDLRSILPIFALFVLGSCGQESERDLVATARAIHDRVITIDTHNDINPSNFSAERNYTMDLNTQVNIPKMESGGLDVSWMIVYVGQGPLNPEGYANAYDTAIAKFEAIHRLAEEIAPEQIEIAYTSEDVRRIAASGKKVAMIGIENAYPIGLDLSNIRKFQERGGRYMSLAHNGHNQLSDSNTGERDDIWMHNGLSDLGKQAVAEMNRWGIMVDISHPSKEAIMQMIELSKAPVMASHSSARSLNDVSRNLDDEQLKAVQANGGVVQTVAFSSYVDSDKNTRNREALTALQQEVASELGIELLDRSAMRSMSAEERSSYATKMEAVNELTEPRISEEVNSDAPPVDVADFVNHIDYLVDLIGIDHVGISSDFDGGGGVEGWNDASETFAVTLELVQRGYTEADIAKLWGENLLRVLDEVQRIASEIQSS
ncbi:MAG: peptidase M19 [Candidatus Marinimicrobia bacterium]|nr:peptidase M19 [Candidatus Neomarinimicrobiota bacterium]